MCIKSASVPIAMRPAGALLCCMTDRDVRSVPGRPGAARSPEDLRFTGDPAGVCVCRGIRRRLVEQDPPLLWGRREPGTGPLARLMLAETLEDPEPPASLVSAFADEVVGRLPERRFELTGADESLIQYVKDRPGHDRRYSLSSEKTEALGWKAQVPFTEGIAATVEWYRKNAWWWEPIRSGDYRDYYQRQYGRELRS